VESAATALEKEFAVDRSASDLNEDEKAFVKNGNILGAVKSLRNRSLGLGLSGAKEIVDAYIASGK
jgi:hypothetical protein